MYNWKFFNVTKEQLEKMEGVQIETVATIKEKIYPDNAGNGMPSKQHWFTKEMKTLEKYYFKDIENQIYYYEFVANDYQIRELKLSKDNWNEYNILLDDGTEEEVQAFLKDCFDNVFEDFEHITDTEIVDRPNYVGTDFWIKEIRIEELMTDMEKNLIRKLKRKYK